MKVDDTNPGTQRILGRSEILEMLSMVEQPAHPRRDRTELFVDGEATLIAIRLYLDGALSLEDMLAVEGTTRTPGGLARIVRVSQALDAQEAAVVRRATQIDDKETPRVALRVDGFPLEQLFHPPEVRLHVAAREVDGRTVQVSSADARVTLFIKERLEPRLGDGILVIRVRTKNDPHLLYAQGRFEVLVDNQPIAVYPIKIVQGRLATEVGFLRTQVSSDRVGFRLVIGGDTP